MHSTQWISQNTLYAAEIITLKINVMRSFVCTLKKETMLSWQVRGGELLSFAVTEGHTGDTASRTEPWGGGLRTHK